MVQVLTLRIPMSTIDMPVTLIHTARFTQKSLLKSLSKIGNYFEISCNPGIFSNISLSE